MKIQTFPLKNTFYKKFPYDFNDSIAQIFDNFDGKFVSNITNGEINSLEISDKNAPNSRIIRILVPNLSKNDLDIELYKNELTISYKPSDQTVPKMFAPSSFSKTFIIGQEFDLDKIELNLDKGLLYIIIPIKEIIGKEFETKKLQIN